MLKKSILFNSFLFFFIIANLKSNISYGEEYLDTVIQKINKMESELEKLQSENSSLKNNDSANISNDTIASHEKRLLDLEEEFRSINGKIDEVMFDLKNISNELLELKTNKANKDNVLESTESENDLNTEVEITRKVETITTEDPNMKDNPSMQVLGVITENEKTNATNQIKKQGKENVLQEKNSVDSNLEKTQIDQQLANLSKDPSDIYKHAYNMLIQENFLEAEKYFNIFIGENPKDPLASNAYYWLGETFYVQKQFQKAAISFAKGYQQFPKGNKALDQLFKLSLTFINLGKNEDACASFSKLEIEFPNAPKRIKGRVKDYKDRAKC